VADRFNRDYRLTIGLGSRSVIILPPFRVAFSIDKSDKAELNKGTIKVYNLNPDKRKVLIRDSDEKGADTGNNSYFPLQLQIGYQGRLETIFKGSVDEAGSVKAGAEWETTLSVMDGGHDFMRGFISESVTSKAAVVDAVLGTMPNTSKGKIGAMGELIRPKVLVGNSVAVIQEMLDIDQRWFIDDERLNILGGNEVVSGYIPVISADTGLTGTPESDKKEVTLTTWLNPSVKVGGLFQLISVTAPHLNGIYKSSVITYTGDFDGSDWTQKITGVISDSYVVPK